jgi:hypothetical protein
MDHLKVKLKIAVDWNSREWISIGIWDRNAARIGRLSFSADQLCPLDSLYAK